MPKQDKRVEKYETKKGIRYRFKTYVGTDINGKKVWATRSGFTSYTEAKYELDKLKLEGVDSFVKQKQIKVNDLFTQWFDTYQTTVKESTAHKTYEMYKIHIKPKYGNAYVDKITPASLQRDANALSKKLVKYRTALGILERTLNLGISLGYLKVNPFSKILIPKKTTRKRRDTSINFLSREELDTFLKKTESINHLYYLFFLLLASTGLRKGEALALHWSDIDFNTNQISVTKTLAYGLDNKYIVQTPKSPKSLRTVPLSTHLKEELLKYKDNQKIDTEIIFHTIDGNYLRLSKPTRWLDTIYKQLPDLKRITTHGFRHTFASLLIESNPYIKPSDVQAILGHETVEMTLNIYTHVTNQSKKKVAQSINDLNI